MCLLSLPMFTSHGSIVILCMIVEAQFNLQIISYGLPNCVLQSVVISF